MKEITDFQQKKVLILGLAKSGVAAAQLLHKLGAFVTVNDRQPFEDSPDAQFLLSEGITVICGYHPEHILDEGFEYVIKNPGIRYDNPIVEDAIHRGIPVFTEVELAYLISEAPFIGITGSNGKTTTTTLLYHLLNIGGKRPLIAGNIGTVACSVAEKAEADQVIVTELSSFQLMGTQKFRPTIAIWTNLYEAHLDYHGDFDAYGEAKFKITSNQTSDDWLIYNSEQEIVCSYAEKSVAKKIPFSVSGKTDVGISADEEMVYWQGEALLKRSIIALPGKHNLENILCATAAALLSGCTVETIVHVLSSFTGVRHRTQYVREWNKRKFYNDSKATNTLATKSALEAFRQPTILLCGGLDRGHSFEEMRGNMNDVKGMVVFGETADRLEEFGRSCGITDIMKADGMDDIVEKAVAISEEGDVILLSPACASWDQYPNFEMRGDEFIRAVMKI
ncbi:UDP-N-acetylmuramoyl-L-alanine--D-glutamate ligase [Chungangia koreensis]|uniref:UDP-N-acetylmuramoylalanine--D-glutamate ligase n=1 Tax=Chungangia koreensis TaxID=752657 RepID=A0ABV8X0M0_9LACT